MRILHLSDFHLRGDGGLSFRVVDTLECLRVVADHLKTLVQKPDALVITGDLADMTDIAAVGKSLYIGFERTATGSFPVIDNVTLTATAVPEPSTYGLLGAGALAAVAFVRRRRKFAGKAV